MNEDLNKNFFGRALILNLMKKRVRDIKDGYRQNIALLGNRYVGKSTILHHFLSNLDDRDIVTIYADLESKDFHYFFKKFASSLLYNFAKSRELELHEDLNLLLETTKKAIPHTAQVVKKIQTELNNSRKLTDAFLGLLTLPEIFTNETGKFCVLILDEFQALEGFSIANVFQYLGKKIMTQKRCLYIVSSSYPAMATKILSEKLSLLFGNFEIINVVPFDLKSSRKGIEHHLGAIKIGDPLRHFLADFTGGYPLYLNLICQELRNLCALHQQGEIFIPLLSQAVENTLFDRWGVINRHLELILHELAGSKGHPLTIGVLLSLANGKHKMDEIMGDAGISKSQLNPRIHRLLEGGVLVKNGSGYYFKDKLFKYWLKYVYQPRLKCVELTPQQPRKEFREEFCRCIEAFRISFHTNFSSRIVELLHCFDNESFDLNGQRYRLPLFREVIPLHLEREKGPSYEVLKASTGEAVWFIVLKKANFEENDMTVVLEELRKTGEKPERCVIISLAGLDENTRLKALQERFWIWSEEEINTLLTLFDKPCIVQ